MSKQNEDSKKDKDESDLFNAIIKAAVNEYRVTALVDKRIIPMSDKVDEHVTDKLLKHLLPTLQGLGDKITIKDSKERKSIINGIVEGLQIHGTIAASGGYTIKQEDIKDKLIPTLKTVIEPAYDIVRDALRELANATGTGSKMNLKLQDHFANKLMSTVGPVLNEFTPKYLEHAKVKLIEDVKNGIEKRIKKVNRNGEVSIEKEECKKIAIEIAEDHAMPHLLVNMVVKSGVKEQIQEGTKKGAAAPTSTPKGTQKQGVYSL